MLPQPTDRSLFPSLTSKPRLAAGTTLVLMGEDVAVSGADPPITIRWCVRDEHGEALQVGGVGGEGQTLTLKEEPPFESHSTFLVQGRTQKLSVRISNICGWGRISPDPYQNRGCTSARLDPLRLSSRCLVPCRLDDSPFAGLTGPLPSQGAAPSLRLPSTPGASAT